MKSQNRKTSHPEDVQEIETAWIPLSDGNRLAARIWLPACAKERQVAAVMEYIPYRRRDLSRSRDEPMHRYFAERGYASLRVDLRGSGDSDGLLEDEYTRQEWDDGVEAIAWIAAQRWCNGSVGMIGLSWGGFTALQIAALRPPALKAIVTVGSTDDRYRDDMHYTGGCLIDDQMEWGTGFLCYLGLPPDPEVVGDAWRRMWLSRLDHLRPPVHRWLRHQWRDAYWKHGSVCERFADIEAAVYAVGGWADGYTNSVFRLMHGLSAPRRATVGPWGHLYPHEGVPGPAVGFLQDALRWWERWLDGVDNGVMDEPACRLWLQDRVQPGPCHRERPGRWVVTDEWPTADTDPVTFHLWRTGLRSHAGDTARVEISSPQTVGIAAGEWYGKGNPAGEPVDQRVDDSFSVCFDTEPLAERFEMIGAPVLDLELECDRPVGLLAARLNDVSPDGSSLRVSYAVLNLTHRHGHETPVPLVPGERTTVRVELDHAAHAFAPGHRIRLALSTSYWPLAWPAPEVVRVGVHRGRATLTLARLKPGAGSPEASPFGHPEKARAMARAVHHLGQSRRTVLEDVGTGEVRINEFRDMGDFRILAHGLRFHEVSEIEHAIRRDDPVSARCTARREFTCSRGQWHVRIDARTTLTCTREAFQVTSACEAYESGRRVFARAWHDDIPRMLV